MDSSSEPDTAEGDSRLGTGAAVRVLATLSLLALVATYVAAQVDFLRRHKPGIPPLKYWLPQARLIWAPGLALALVCAAAAFALHRWGRRK
jgi:hypothetical protein